VATKSFAINTEPHRAEVGEHVLLFQPEVVGAEFAQAYSGLRDAQKRVKDVGDDVGAADLLAVNEAMRSFLSGLMLPESVKVFEEMRLPDRVLVQLLEWVASLYGGGVEERPTGQSSGS
jgi:hypothetical protein